VLIMWETELGLSDAAPDTPLGAGLPGPGREQDGGRLSSGPRGSCARLTRELVAYIAGASRPRCTCNRRRQPGNMNRTRRS
jgi:hypothetical protein